MLHHGRAFRELKQLVRTASRRISSLETASENESRFFRKRIVYGEKGVRPIAVCVGTPIEPSKLFRAVKERIEVDDKERKHL